MKFSKSMADAIIKNRDKRTVEEMDRIGKAIIRFFPESKRGENFQPDQFQENYEEFMGLWLGMTRDEQDAYIERGNLNG